ncbi:MAG: hypothetical protein A2927_01140 [Candidatus Komeilibacteria bacterium RIFCSPLOWO2_01_FULL_45_10]|uniref:Uncharacterized protein n=1 Tax=Candidatus Komeilibacteria bacterium RIFCSPLOWO2_01_FULL_45_10 TaxID=1798550 RepID=A0A1G2BNB4_9BACT|nr:MAG: hypothetical protein A2927_01140 [Candidatus Komeilibacteria bacterium RIFCSPLOWO2_01_FULL_45_10]
MILKKFNKDMLWILPMTSQNRSNEFYHQVEYQNQKYAVILSQLRLISSKRLLRKIRTISKGEFKEIKEKIKSFLQKKTIPDVRRRRNRGLGGLSPLLF